MRKVSIQARITDYKALKAIPQENVVQYLTGRGWINVGRWAKRPVHIYMKDEGYTIREILVADHNELADWPNRMSELIGDLSKWEDRSALDIYYDLTGDPAALTYNRLVDDLDEHRYPPQYPSIRDMAIAGMVSRELLRHMVNGLMKMHEQEE